MSAQVPPTSEAAAEPLASGPTDEAKWTLVERILRGELSPADARREQNISVAVLHEWVRDYRRAARRAVDAELAARLSVAGLDLGLLEAGEFVGRVEGMAVAELIQTISYGRRDALIRVDRGSEHGEIWCVAGEIVDAACGSLQGSAAVYRLLSWRDGQIQADFSPRAHARKIEASTPALLFEAARRFDDSNRLRERIGDTNAVYAAKPPVGGLADDELGAEVLGAFDGRRSVSEVVEGSRLPDFEVLSAIARLLDAGYLVRAPEAAPTPRLIAPVAPRREGPARVSLAPLVTSLRVRAGERGRARLYVSAAAGALIVASAFAIGFLSARRQSEAAGSPGHAAAGLERPMSCPRGMALASGEAPGGSAEERFCIAETVVSAGEYQSCVVSGECVALDREPRSTGSDGALAASAGAECNIDRPGHERYPANCVSYEQARQYCRSRGARLPTEQEWRVATGGAANVRRSPGLAEWATGHRVARPGAAQNELGPRYHAVVLGGGLVADTDPSNTAVTRLALSADTRGRNVGFRCASQPEALRTAAAHRD